MKKPYKLKTGDTIGIVNPCGMPPDRFFSQIARVEGWLQTEGFRTKKIFAGHCASNKEHAEIFTSAWNAEGVSAIFPICGSSRIYNVIEHLDKKDFVGSAPIFCGSSFVSALSTWLAQKLDLVTFFGPHVAFLHPQAPCKENEFTIQSFWDMLMWKQGRKKYITGIHERHHFFKVDEISTKCRISNIYNEPEKIKDYRRRDAFFFSTTKEKIYGLTICISLGCLLEMCRRGMVSTLSGCVLFVESVDWRIQQTLEAILEISQNLHFNNVKGIWITALTERTDRKEPLFKELREKSYIQLLCNRISQNIGVPVLYGFPMGHCSYKLTLPQRVRCEIDPFDGSLCIEEVPFSTKQAH